MQVHQIINDLALQEPMYIVHNDPLAHIDQFDKAQVEIRDGGVEWHMVFDPTFKVVHCVSVFPSNVLFSKKKTNRGLVTSTSIHQKATR